MSSILELHIEGSDVFTLRFQLKRTPVAQKWVALLKRKLARGKPFREPPAIFKAFTALGRNAETAWSEVMACARKIDAYDGRHLPLGFQEFTRSQANLNSLHKSFEVMRGEMREETPFYKAATPEIQDAIYNLNERIHETETLNGMPQGLGGVIKVQLSDIDAVPFEPLDFNEFQLTRNFGDLYLHYCQVGKPWLDVFQDQDDLVSPENIRPLTGYNGEFDIGFSDVGHDRPEDFRRRLGEWLEARGLNPRNPKLSLGWIVVGSLMDDGQTRERICREVALRQSLKSITFR